MTTKVTMRYVSSAVEFDTECMIPGDVHSCDMVEVWHGLATPAVGCGFHVFECDPSGLYAAHAAILAGERFTGLCADHAADPCPICDGAS